MLLISKPVSRLMSLYLDTILHRLLAEKLSSCSAGCVRNAIAQWKKLFHAWYSNLVKKKSRIVWEKCRRDFRMTLYKKYFWITFWSISKTIEWKYKTCSIERYVTICWVRHDVVVFHLQVVWYTKSPWILHKVWMLGHNKTLILTSTNLLQQVRICTCSAAWSSRSSRWDRPAATPSLWTQAVSPWGSRGGQWA